MQTVITVIKLPGQALLLQFVVSVLLPAQGVPSVSGDGLSQLLSRVLVPPSQETEHSDPSSQELQPPFTKTY